MKFLIANMKMTKSMEIIGRFVRPGEPLTKDESALLKASGFNIVETP